MNRKLPATSIEEKIYAATRVPEPRPEFLHALGSRLARQPRILETPRPGPHSLQDWFFALIQRPARAACMIILIVLVAVFLAVGPQRVIAALSSLFGYVPGIGLVQNGADLQILAGPAHQQKDSVSLTVEQGAADRQRTVIIYRADGLSLKAASAQGETAPTGSIAVLLLPDGAILTQTSASLSGWGTGYQARLVFPPLPQGDHAATLLISRLETMPSGAAPEDWRLPVYFTTPPADLKIMPVYELATRSDPLAASATVMATAGLAGPSPHVTEPANTTIQNGVQLTLDRVIEREDGFQLQGSITWNNQPYSDVYFDLYDGGTYQLSSADGQVVPFEEAEADPANPGNALSGASRPWAIRTGRKIFSGPLRFSVSRLHVDQEIPPGQVVFQVDLGDHPQPGQTWEPGQEVTVAGKMLRLVTAALETNPRDGGPVLNLVFEGDPSVSGVGIVDPDNRPDSDHPGAGGGGGGGSDTAAISGRFTASIPYYQMPSGIRQVQVVSISTILDGPWSVRWEPPTVSGMPETTQAQAACLTSQKWQQAGEQPQAPAPDGLTGLLLVEENQGQLMPHLSLVRVDGSQRQDLVTGGWSSLAPDGKTVAFIESDGPALYLLDVASGAKQSVPGTTPEDYHPVWSPDGGWLAFVRSNAGIYVVQRDGNNLRQVVDGSRIRFLSGWLSDGSGLVIASLTGEGSQVQTVDLASGQVQDRFVIKNAKGGFIQLSPDGRRVAFSETAFGLPGYGIYAANLDGSAKRLVAGLESGGVSAGAWSPDGRWLALTGTVQDDAAQTERTILVQVDTCQAWPVPGLTGRVTGWAALQP